MTQDVYGRPPWSRPRSAERDAYDRLVSGSVTIQDADPVSERGHPDAATVEISESRPAQVGAFQVRRALPRRKRRTVVARTQAEIAATYQDWTAGGDRFGRVASELPRIEVGPPPWLNAPG